MPVITTRLDGFVLALLDARTTRPWARPAVVVA